MHACLDPACAQLRGDVRGRGRGTSLVISKAGPMQRIELILFCAIAVHITVPYT